jgi:signal transduction histidine kinase
MRTHRSGPSGKCKLHWNEAEIWRQADSRKNEFLATFAHELRNLSRQ